MTRHVGCTRSSSSCSSMTARDVCRGCMYYGQNGNDYQIGLTLCSCLQSDHYDTTVIVYTLLADSPLPTVPSHHLFFLLLVPISLPSYFIAKPTRDSSLIVPLSLPLSVAALLLERRLIDTGYPSTIDTIEGIISFH